MIPRSPRLATAAALAVASVAALAGCAPEPVGPGDDVVTVVASTNVYGQLAEVIGGDAVAVVSIIDSPAQDPHSYEPSARDQLTVSRADLVIENGGGYDAFMDGLIEATATDAPVLTAVEFSSEWPGGDDHPDSDHPDSDHDDHADSDHPDSDSGEHAHDHVEGFNEHVWYDLEAMGDVAAGIQSQLETLHPAEAETFAANLASFRSQLEVLERRIADLGETYGGTEIFVTEPVPLYLTGAADLVNVTPPAFSESVEEGQDVAPATLLDAIHLIERGHVQVVIVNSQTGGVETDAVIAEARDAGNPVLEFSEVLPDDLTYVDWMEQNIIALGKGLYA